MYFYNKAVQLGENPNLQDFCYPGPRPQSKEAAIVMLADSVEASSRTLVDPTPARIRAHVTKIVNGVYAEGQLDESDLTFRDLSKLVDAFVRIITGLFHQRIAYPDQVRMKKENKEEAQELRPEWMVSAGKNGLPLPIMDPPVHERSKKVFSDTEESVGFCGKGRRRGIGRTQGTEQRRGAERSGEKMKDEMLTKGIRVTMHVPCRFCRREWQNWMKECVGLPLRRPLPGQVCSPVATRPCFLFLLWSLL
jgi:hypothetical protein